MGHNNAISTETARNEVPNTLQLKKSVEDFQQFIGENVMKKVENTQQPPREELDFTHCLYNFLEKNLNIQIRLTEMATDPAEEDYSDTIDITVPNLRTSFDKSNIFIKYSYEFQYSSTGTEVFRRKQFSEPENKDITTSIAEDRSQWLKEILEWMHSPERKV